MSGVIQCNHCGKQLRADNIYCTQCGKELSHVPSSLCETDGLPQTENSSSRAQATTETQNERPVIPQKPINSSQDDNLSALEPDGPAQEALASIVSVALAMDDEGQYPGSCLSLLNEHILQYPENAGEASYYKGVILNHSLNPAPNVMEIFSCFDRALELGENRAAIHLMRLVYERGDDISVPHKSWEEYARISVYQAGDMKAATFLALSLVLGETGEAYEDEGHKLLVLTSTQGDHILPSMLKGELLKLSDENFDLLIDSYGSTLSELPQEDAKFKIVSENLYDYACTYISDSGDQWQGRILRIAELLSAYDCAPAYNTQGIILEEGINGEQDLQGAEDYYKKALELGDSEALYRLGYLHMGESGATPNYVAAEEYFRKAIEKKHPVAPNGLIYLLRNELVPMEDEGELIRLLLQAMEEETITQDNAFYLATLYLDGTDNLPQDEQKAISIFELISETYPDAKVYLAYHYIETETNIEKAIEYLEEVVKTNHPMGLYTYGDFLLEKADKNDLAQADEVRALDYLERAYELGINLAAVSLSAYYLRRCNNPLNYPQAITWSQRTLSIEGVNTVTTKIGIDAVLEKACAENIDPLTGLATTEPQVWIKMDGGKVSNNIAIERGVVNSIAPLTLPMPDTSMKQPSMTEAKGVTEAVSLETNKQEQLKTTGTATPDSLPSEPQQQLWIIEYNNIRNTGDKTKALVHATLKYEAYPNSYFANYMLGVSKMDFGEIGDAVVCFDRALNAGPQPAESYERISSMLFNSGHYLHASAFAGKGLEKYPDNVPLFYTRFESLRETSTPDFSRDRLAIEGKSVPKIYRDMFLAFSYYDDLFELADNIVIDGETERRFLGEEKIKKAKLLVAKFKQAIPADVPAEVTKAYPEFAELLKEDIKGLRTEAKVTEELIEFECKKKFIFEYARIPLIAVVLSIFLFRFAGFLAFLLLVFGVIGVLASRVPRWRLFAHHYPGSPLPAYNLFYAYRDFFRDISSSRD